MYQTINRKFKEECLTHLTTLLEENIARFKLEVNSSKLDLTKKYTPNWACLWNNPNNIGKSCKILQRNEKVAIVVFEGENSISKEKLLEHIYRIEDLSLF